jgi:magnesium transporter
MPKKGAVFLRIFRPTERDFEFLKAKFGILPALLHESSAPSAQPRIEQRDGYLFFSYYVPLYDPKQGATNRIAIDFIATRDTVAAIHHEKVDAFDAFAELHAEGAPKLLSDVVCALIEFQERQLRHVRERIETINAELAKGVKRDVLERLFHAARDFAEYRSIVALQHATLESLRAKGKALWGARGEASLETLLSAHLYLTNHVERYREMLVASERMNAQRVSVHIHGMLKSLAILTLFTLPLGLIALVLTIPARGTPLLDLPGSFWIIILLMAAAAASLTFYLKRRGWF